MQSQEESRYAQLLPLPSPHAAVSPISAHLAAASRRILTPRGPLPPLSVQASPPPLPSPPQMRVRPQHRRIRVADKTSSSRIGAGARPVAAVAAVVQPTTAPSPFMLPTAAAAGPAGEPLAHAQRSLLPVVPSQATPSTVRTKAVDGSAPTEKAAAEMSLQQPPQQPQDQQSTMSSWWSTVLWIVGVLAAIALIGVAIWLIGSWMQSTMPLDALSSSSSAVHATKNLQPVSAAQFSGAPKHATAPAAATPIATIQPQLQSVNAPNNYQLENDDTESFIAALSPAAQSVFYHTSVQSALTDASASGVYPVGVVRRLAAEFSAVYQDAKEGVDAAAEHLAARLRRGAGGVADV